MENDFWINLASKDLTRAKEFFTQLGFRINEQHSSAQMVSLFVGSKKVVLNLFPEGMFKNFIGGQLPTKTSDSNEVLFSIGATSVTEVDELARKAVEAGGTLYGKPGFTDGWMYGCGFTDLDGHRWNVLFMDMSKVPR